INNISELDDKEILELIQKYGGHLPLLIDVIDKQLCLLKLTQKNWTEKKEIAERYRFPIFTKKCFDFASEMIEKDIRGNKRLTSMGIHWLQECSLMGKFENKELLNLLFKSITFDNLHVLFNIAKQQKNERLLVACDNFIQSNPSACLKLIKNEWMQSILTDLNEADYSKFSIGLLGKISIDSVRVIFEFAHNKKDEKLLEASIAFIGKNIQKIKDEQVWTLEEIPEEILMVLYPTKI
nr:hypothetical protein [Nitrosopumilus sp.]